MRSREKKNERTNTRGRKGEKKTGGGRWREGRKAEDRKSGEEQTEVEKRRIEAGRNEKK